MGAPGDLTTLANVKAWRSPPIVTSSDDTQITRAVAAASTFIRHFLQRALVSAAYSETRNGTGGRELMLRHAPVTAVATVSVDGHAISPAPDSVSAGYVPDGAAGMIYLRGHAFHRGVQNVVIAYTAGHLVVDEAQTIPNAAPYQLSCASLARLWADDSAVAYAGGGALTPATTPSAGQYVAPTAPDGFYGFAAADAGKPIVVSYSYTPADIEQACIELVLLRIGERGRIGEAAKTLAGEVASFTQSELTPSIAAALQPYRRVVPLL